MKMDDEDDPIFYGLEVEVDSGHHKREVAEYLEDTLGDYFYCSNDGSLSPAGFEAKTVPCSLRYHMSDFPWSDFREIIRSYDYKSHNTSTCGLHIHMSRDGITDVDFVKMGLFWYSHVPFIEKIARRGMTGYCEGKSWKSHLHSMKNQKWKANSSPRESLNFGSTQGVEVRAFKGTLNINTILASIQLLDLLIKWVHSKGSAWLVTPEAEDAFIRHVLKSKYKEIKKYFKERHVI
jgi:hypothetical protein